MTGPAAPETRGGAAARWPGVLGVLGIVLAALTLLDKLGDLVVLLLWTGEDLVTELGAEIGTAVAPLIPPDSWIALTSVVWAGLAVLLLVGSLRLRRRQVGGVALCRLWSWLAIVWFTVEMGFGLWWLERISGQLTALAPGGWKGYAVVGILIAVVFMLAYPVFLLVWLARPAVRREIAEWSSSGA